MLKNFTEFQHSFLIKISLNKLRIEDNILNKEYHEKHIVLNGERQNTFPLRSRIRMFSLTNSIQCFTGVSSQYTEVRKRNKRCPIEKEEVKYYLYSDAMITYVTKSNKIYKQTKLILASLQDT